MNFQGAPRSTEGQVRGVRPRAAEREAADLSPEGRPRQEEDLSKVRVRREKGTIRFQSGFAVVTVLTGHMFPNLEPVPEI